MSVKDINDSEKSGDAQARARDTMSGIDVWCRFDKAKDVTSLVPNPRNPNKHHIERYPKGKQAMDNERETLVETVTNG